MRIPIVLSRAISAPGAIAVVIGLVPDGIVFLRTRKGSIMQGIVVKLDRGYPLVELEGGLQYRCEHATSLVKTADVRAACGDRVEISVPEGHDKGIIERVLPRRNAFVRKDPTERMEPQVLAANFDKVFVAEPCSGLNVRRLERNWCSLMKSGAEVIVLLTKATRRKVSKKCVGCKPWWSGLLRARAC